MNLNPFLASYRAYASLLTADQNLRKRDWKAKLIGTAARLGTFVLSELAIQAIVGIELSAGALTGPFALIVEPVMGLLGLGEEGAGIMYVSPKIADLVGRKVDAWYDRTRADNQIINVQYQEVPSLSLPPPLPTAQPASQPHGLQKPPPLPGPR